MAWLWLFAVLAWSADGVRAVPAASPAWLAAERPADPRWHPVRDAARHLDRRLAGRRASAMFVPTVARLDVHWALLSQNVEPLPLDRDFQDRALDRVTAASLLMLRDLVRDAARRHEGFSAAQSTVSKYSRAGLATEHRAPSGVRTTASTGFRLRMRDLDEGDDIPLVDASLQARLQRGPLRVTASALLVRRLWVVRTRHRLHARLTVHTSLRSTPGRLRPDSIRMSTWTPLGHGLALRGWWLQGLRGKLLDHRAGASIQAMWGGRARTARPWEPGVPSG